MSKNEKGLIRDFGVKNGAAKKFDFSRLKSTLLKKFDFSG